MAWLSSPKYTRHLPIPMGVVVLLLALCWWPHRGYAHFSYSDPRIIHIVDDGGDQARVLIRMPAPLALLPDDWQGQNETRLPPFGINNGPDIFLDAHAIENNTSELLDILNRSASIWIDGHRSDTKVEQFRFWADTERPSFGTVKSATAAFQEAAQTDLAALSYFNLTVDVALSVPSGSLNQDLRVTSDLGKNFQVMDRFGTVVKLHRSDTVETQAMIGVLDVSYPATSNKWIVMRDAALIGAEHIYFGLDHLAIIVLIAIAAQSWRQALGMASAFTIGHMITLAAGLYGIAPATIWFIPLVEFSIALSIVVAGAFICFQIRHPLNWLALFVIGLVHGYGFAASASQAMFAGQFDFLDLLAFAFGLEACQFAIYAMILPIILLADRQFPLVHDTWRRGVALLIAVFAASATFTRFTESTGAFGLV
ncbi:HupE/UreJ family protein [Ruegeria arenilitoris]|uniref:HupE/UreJ family protein n=1 Tax=Ruegeria arenilitoris TaxID=1173585 RepID=UPI0014807FF7|nr:HupE/UreJ family protein [Ruegeria arenilitoris]